jgi:hypothetical protein
MKATTTSNARGLLHDSSQQQQLDSRSLQGLVASSLALDRSPPSLQSRSVALSKQARRQTIRRVLQEAMDLLDQEDLFGESAF